MPKELEETKSPVEIISDKAYKEQQIRIKNKELTNMEKSFGVSRGITKQMESDYIAKYGHADWYHWRIANWDTKWGAFSTNRIKNEISFQTAWSTPYAIIKALSNMFPDVELIVKHADDDFGHNVGEYAFIYGNCIRETNYQGGSYEAVKLSMELLEGDESYWLTDFLTELDEEKKNYHNELDEFEQSIIRIAHEHQALQSNYSKPVLLRLKEMALNEEQYERVAEIDKYLSTNQLV
jgi:hypothetical protein